MTSPSRRGSLLGAEEAHKLAHGPTSPTPNKGSSDTLCETLPRMTLEVTQGTPTSPSRDLGSHPRDLDKSPKGPLKSLKGLRQVTQGTLEVTRRTWVSPSRDLGSPSRDFGSHPRDPNKYIEGLQKSNDVLQKSLRQNRCEL